MGLMRYLLMVLGLIFVSAALLYFSRRSGVLSPPLPKISVQKINLKTKDGVNLVGDYYPPAPSANDGGVLLLHMMPADRKSWTEFAKKLASASFAVLAIDLRGHGESQGGPDGYQKFSDAQHQASIWDAEAGADFLKKSGVKFLHLGGASIGANLALEYLANHPEARSAVLLSAGLDYRGIKTETLASKIKLEQAVYFVASFDDMRSSGFSATDMSQKLFDLCRCKKDIKKFAGADHGTAILQTYPEFMDELAFWFEKQNF